MGNERLGNNPMMMIGQTYRLKPSKKSISLEDLLDYCNIVNPIVHHRQIR